MEKFGTKFESVPILRLFGSTMDGNSVCCHVHRFFPYFFMDAPNGFGQISCDELKASLNLHLIAGNEINEDDTPRPILNISLVKGRSMHGYRDDESEFIKITLALPQLVAAVVRLFEIADKQISTKFSFKKCRFYENDIDFVLRFMVDTHVVGCSWIELPAGAYTLRSQYGNPPLSTRCQIEADIEYDRFIAHEPRGDWAKVAPFRILSIDIECAGRKGIFPEPQQDPIVQIANVMSIAGYNEHNLRKIFTFDTCNPIHDSQVVIDVTETVSI